MTSPALSLVDFSSFTEGERPRDAFAHSVHMAKKAEELGYSRVWYSEHHNTGSIASSVPSLMIAHVAAQTERIRLGAGGVMLPNHSPYVVAEEYGTLEEMYPGRIDLGLGRAPGTDRTTLARALRRDVNAAENFPADILELAGYLSGESPIAGIRAIPGEYTNVPLYVLGSSLYGAQLAAHLGLPYSFAAHLFPPMLHEALKVYRDNFQPSELLDRPYIIVALNATASRTEEESRRIHGLEVRNHVAGMHYNGKPHTSEMLDQLMQSPAGRQYASMLDYFAYGTGEQAAAYLQQFASETGADELMLHIKGGGTAGNLEAMELIAHTWGLDPAHAAGDPTGWVRSV